MGLGFRVCGLGVEGLSRGLGRRLSELSLNVGFGSSLISVLRARRGFLNREEEALKHVERVWIRESTLNAR